MEKLSKSLSDCHLGASVHAKICVLDADAIFGYIFFPFNFLISKGNEIQSITYVSRKFILQK